MKNTTGLPQTDDYLIGRGILYLSLIDSTTGLPTGGWLDVGNSPDFKLTLSSETLKHTSSRGGLATTDKEVTLSQDMAIGFSMDEVNDYNLSLFLSGTTATYTNAAVAGFAAWAMVPAGQASQGRWYDLRSSAGVRAYGVTAANVTVANGGTTFVQGTDYTVDTDMGRIFLIASSAAVIAAVSGSSALTVTLAANAQAKNVDEVRALTQSSIVCALKFISSNPARADRKTEFTIHKATLSADGDFNLISNDWTKLTFKATAQQNVLASSTSPTMTVRSLAA